MSEPITQAFTVAFLTTCFNEGLDQSAAAALLQKESADQARAVHPGFARGYDSMLKLAGVQPPMIKAAGPRIDNVMKILRGIGQALRGGGGLAAEGVKDVGRAGRAIAGPRNPSSMLNKYPFPTFLAGTGLAAGGTALGLHLMNQDRGLMQPNMDPFFPPSGYNPADAEKRYEDQLYKGYGPGISQHNKNYYGTYGRRKELEAAIRENRDFSGQAYQELQHLNKRHEADKKGREGYMNQLSNYGDYNQQLLDRIGKRQQQLEGRRKSIWGLPQRTWLRLRGKDPEQFYNQQIGALEGSAAQAHIAARGAADRRRMLEAGYVGRREQPKQDINSLQKRFFPTDN